MNFCAGEENFAENTLLGVDLILLRGKIIIITLYPGRYRGKGRCSDE